jgi:uncharacterized protein YbjT (DUF2867 family)
VNVLLTGISGYIGSRLAPRLKRDGHTVRGMARDPSRVAVDAPTVAANAISGDGLARALEGIDAAYYLIHSMEPSDDSFDVRDRIAAENFAQAAAHAGVRQIVYLGGLVPSGAGASLHLASRLEVERILLAAAPGSTALRASIVIGAGSRSFRFLVRLVERLPVLALPAWRENRTAPIDERDVVELLARALGETRVSGLSLDIGGPDVVAYGRLIEMIRDHLLLDRPRIPLPRLSLTPIASRISALIAGEDHSLIGPLMEGLGSDLLPRDARAAELLGVKLHSLDAAIERALRQWEETEPLAAR